jgi:hypothetical protein
MESTMTTLAVIFAQRPPDFPQFTMKSGGPSPEEAGTMAILALVCQMAFIAAFVLFAIVVQWKIFAKAGKPGWAAIIPIYNMIVHLQIIDKPLWLIALVLIPCVNFIGAFVYGWIVSMETAKVFGKGTGFGLGLFFLGIIFYPILAFGSAQYQAPAGALAGAGGGPRPGSGARPPIQGQRRR